MSTLDFDVEYRYVSTPEGIHIPIRLVLADRAVDLTARLDTGAADCVLDRFFADVLAIDVESGVRQVYRTVAGSFVAYGHEMTIRTLGLEWSATVYFYEATGRQNSFIGRRGWLDRVRLALVHFDERIYLAPYDKSP